MQTIVYEPCLACSTKVPTKVEGFYFTDENQTQVFECGCHIKWRQDNTRLIIAKRNNIQTNLFIKNTLTPTNFYHGTKSPEVARKVEMLVKNIDNPVFGNASIYLYGKTGTQKSYLLHWLGYTLTLKGKNVYFAKMSEILEKYIPKGFDVDSIEKSKKYHDILMNADILIIDDFYTYSRSNFQDWQIPHIDGLLRERLETRYKPVYFASDCKPLDSKVTAFGEATRALVDRTIKKTSTYLYCQDVYDYIDDLVDLFKEENPPNEAT